MGREGEKSMAEGEKNGMLTEPASQHPLSVLVPGYKSYCKDSALEPQVTPHPEAPHPSIGYAGFKLSEIQIMSPQGQLAGWVGMTTPAPWSLEVP